MAQAPRDQNFVPAVLFESSTVSGTTITGKIDQATGRILTTAAGGVGTVTSVSVVSANGFAGTVATSTSTPAITISTTITGILQGNGTAISAATTTGSGSVVLATTPTLVTPILGTPTSGTLTNCTGLPIDAGTTGTLTVARGGTNVTGITALSIWVANSANTITEVTPGAGNSIRINGAGNAWEAFTPSASVPTAITVANEATDTSCFLGFFTAATGDLGPKSNANLTFNSSTGVATFGQTISGSITGNAGTVTVADAGGDTTTWVLLGTAQTGNLSPATDDTLTYNATTGALTATSFVGALTGNASTVTFANEATDTTCFIAFATAATGSLEPKTNTNMTFNSNTGVVTFASAVLTTADINGGSVDGATIGASSASTIVGTTITANTGFLPDTDGGAYLGQGTQAFSGLFLDTTATINFDNGNAVITHSSAVLTVSTGDLRVTTAGTNSASVVTVGGTQTLTSKTLTSPAVTTGTYTGTQLLAEGASIGLDPSLSADGTWTGITMTGTAGYTQAFGDLVYLDPTDSRWEAADADVSTAADGDPRGILAMVVVAGTDGNSCTLLLQGVIRADTAFPAMTVNAAMYVGETAGDIQATIPTGADNVIRVVGQAITADMLYFNPSPDWQITVA